MPQLVQTIHKQNEVLTVNQILQRDEPYYNKVIQLFRLHKFVLSNFFNRFQLLHSIMHQCLIVQAKDTIH